VGDKGGGPPLAVGEAECGGYEVFRGGWG
jgi:hypothetical protein